MKKRLETKMKRERKGWAKKQRSADGACKRANAVIGVIVASIIVPTLYLD